MEEYKWFEFLEDISEYNDEENCHIVYDNMVFDVTESLSELGDIVTVEDCGNEVFFTEEEWVDFYEVLIDDYVGEILPPEEDQEEFVVDIQPEQEELVVDIQPEQEATIQVQEETPALSLDTLAFPVVGFLIIAVVIAILVLTMKKEK